MDCYNIKDRNNIQLLTDYELPMSFKCKRVGKLRKNYKKYQNPNNIVSIAVEKMFGKYVEIDNKNCELPAPDTMFINDPWIVDDLKKLKVRLNEMKNKLNDYNLMEWKDHTKKRNYAGDIIGRVRKEVNPELLTQAWCKFYENLSFFNLIPETSINMKQLKSIHLCEAPGAFITALNHWLKLNEPSIDWKWIATTLNPNYEGNSLSSMLNDDRFILHTLNNWYFGVDNTGNLMNLKNLDLLVELEKNNRDKIMLITADGSIDCLNVASEQEKVVSHLHYCETVAALYLLNKNGNFVIKLFTIFEYETVCLMYLLSCCFNKVFIRKPATSKEGNSEIYVTCLDFKGSNYISPYLNMLKKHYEQYTDRAMFRKTDIPNKFIQQIVESGEFFESHQCEVISNNIRTFNVDWNENYIEIKKIRNAVANYFMKFCKLKKLPFDKMEIVGKNTVAQQCYYVLYNEKNNDSYNDRQIKNSMKPEDRLLLLYEDLQCINTMNYMVTIQTLQFIDDEAEILKISTAIPYDNIQSSKFCQPKILKIYNLAFEIKNNLFYDWQFFDDSAITTFKNDKIIVFNYTVKYDGFDVIEKIYDEVRNLDYNQTLVLIRYSLLTQFNVGILYLLIHTFKYIEIQIINEIGCVITLRNYIRVQNIIGYLKDIFDASIVAKNNNKIILSVVPVTRLCECNLYPKMLDVNNRIIKYFVNQVIMAINDSKPK